MQITYDKISYGCVSVKVPMWRCRSSRFSPNRSLGSFVSDKIFQACSSSIKVFIYRCIRHKIQLFEWDLVEQLENNCFHSLQGFMLLAQVYWVLLMRKIMISKRHIFFILIFGFFILFHQRVRFSNITQTYATVTIYCLFTPINFHGAWLFRKSHSFLYYPTGKMRIFFVSFVPRLALLAFVKTMLTTSRQC